MPYAQLQWGFIAPVVLISLLLAGIMTYRLHKRHAAKRTKLLKEVRDCVVAECGRAYATPKATLQRKRICSTPQLARVAVLISLSLASLH